MQKKNKVKEVEVIDSSLEVKPDAKAVESARADLSVPDPTPEKAKAFLNNNKSDK